MIYCFDTEFDDRSRYAPIKLISIGIVAEDGREYYAEDGEYTAADCESASDWLKQNVIPHLKGGAYTKHRQEIAEDIAKFCTDGYSNPEFWAWYCAYDWVLFTKIFDDMAKMPQNFPHWCREIRQLAWTLKVDKSDLPKQTGTLHNALEDAKWNMTTLKFLHDLETARMIMSR